MPVEFDESVPEPSRAASAKKVSGLSELLIKAGIVKSETGAQMIYLLIAVLALAASAYLFASSTKGPPPPTLEQLVP